MGINVRIRKECWLDTKERISVINYKFTEVRKGARGTLLVRSVYFCPCIANSWSFWTITIKKGASIWNVPLHIAHSMQYRCSGYLSDSFTVNFNRYLRHSEISIVLLGYMSTFVRLRLLPHRERSPYQLWRLLVGGKRKFYTNLQVTIFFFLPRFEPMSWNFETFQWPSEVLIVTRVAQWKPHCSMRTDGRTWHSPYSPFASAFLTPLKTLLNVNFC